MSISLHAYTCAYTVYITNVPKSTLISISIWEIPNSHVALYRNKKNSAKNTNFLSFSNRDWMEYEYCLQATLESNLKTIRWKARNVLKFDINFYSEFSRRANFQFSVFLPLVYCFFFAFFLPFSFCFIDIPYISIFPISKFF